MTQTKHQQRNTSDQIRSSNKTQHTQHIAATPGRANETQQNNTGAKQNTDATQPETNIRHTTNQNNTENIQRKKKLSTSDTIIKHTETHHYNKEANTQQNSNKT